MQRQIYACSRQLTAALLSGLLLSACGANLTLMLPSGTDNYALPLKLSQTLECGGGSSLIYEINAKGEFRFLASEVPAKPTFVTRQLSSTDLADLDLVIEKADLEKAQKASPVVAGDAPQTTECRAVDVLNLQHSNRDTAYERNGRKYNYIQDYSSGWAKIRAKLDGLRDKYAPKPTGDLPGSPVANYQYALPLRVEVQGECGLLTYTHFEVTADGLFRYTEKLPDPIGENPTVPIKERKLTAGEQQSLAALLAELDLVRKAVADIPVPADAPQTAECRSVNMLTLTVNGEKRNLDQNGRKLTHSQAYKEAFNKLLSQLQTFSELTAPADSGNYLLPLKVQLAGECGLPSFNRFEITPEGNFTWAREDWPTLIAGNPPTENRKLTQDEMATLVKKLNELDLLKQSASSAPVPADAPQTKECRTVTVYELNAGMGTQTLEGQGTRKFRHSQELLNRLTELQKFLYALSNQKTPTGL